MPRVEACKLRGRWASVCRTAVEVRPAVPFKLESEAKGGAVVGARNAAAVDVACGVDNRAERREEAPRGVEGRILHVWRVLELRLQWVSCCWCCVGGMGSRSPLLLLLLVNWWLVLLWRRAAWGGLVESRARGGG